MLLKARLHVAHAQPARFRHRWQLNLPLRAPPLSGSVLPNFLNQKVEDFLPSVCSLPVLWILVRVRKRHRFPEKRNGSIWIVEQLVSQIPVVVVFLVRSVQLRILCPQIQGSM